MRNVLKWEHATILEEVRFEGTPAEFGSVVRSNREVPDDPLCIVEVIERDPPDPEFCQVGFRALKEDLWLIGITAEKLPRRKARIRVYLPPDNAALGLADHIRAYWQFLHPELVKLGWIVGRRERGMNVGTAERVREAHRLLREGKLSRTKCFRRAHTDPRKYYERCKEVTGEEPIMPGELE